MRNIEKNIPKVLAKIIPNDLCVGCGLCVHSCPNNALKMDWDEYGFLVPTLQGDCDNDTLCIKSCPFNLDPENEIYTEDEIATLFLSDSKRKDPKIGRYNSIYAGYSHGFRQTSSSGGLATYIIAELFDRNIINHVITVTESKGKSTHYEYSLVSSKGDALLGAKTKYYPVTLATALDQIKNIDGKVAVVGVGCFVKAVRMAQYHDDFLKEKITFLVGIICGGLKSSFFTNYLAQKAGAVDNQFVNPAYRIKNQKSTANDYEFGCTEAGKNRPTQVRMQSVGDMWGTGLFKANACDFCDDVTTELADISLGDAWLEPYSKDGLGNNVVVTRSELAEMIITDGIAGKALWLENLALERFLTSQKGSFNHRDKGLRIRAYIKRSRGQAVPTKRDKYNGILIEFIAVQYLRIKVRELSLKIWKKSQDSELFDKQISSWLKMLKIFTSFYHLVQKIRNISVEKVRMKISTQPNKLA